MDDGLVGDSIIITTTTTTTPNGKISTPVWHIERRALLTGHKGIIWWAAWHPTGKLLASVGQDRIIRIWRHIKADSQGEDEDEGGGGGGGGEGEGEGEWQLYEELHDAHSKTIRRATFSPCGQRLATASFDGTVSIWQCQNTRRIKGWKCVATLEGHENEIKGVSWSKDGRLLATCGRDKTVWIWELNTETNNGGDDYGNMMLINNRPNYDEKEDEGEEEEKEKEKEKEVEFECLAVLAEHTQDVKMVIFDPYDDCTLFSASYDDTIRVWRSIDPTGNEDWSCHQIVTGHSSTVWALATTSDGKLMVSAGDDRTILFSHRLPGAKTFSPLGKIMMAHSRAILSIDIDPTDDVLATAGTDRCVKFWQLKRDEYSIESNLMDRKDEDGEVNDLGQFDEFDEVEDFGKLRRLLSVRSPPENDAALVYILPNRIEPNCVQWNPILPGLMIIAGDQGYLELVQIKKLAS